MELIQSQDNSKMVYCFDIDGTLCIQEREDYRRAVPYASRLERVNSLFRAGHIIKLFTARGSRSGKDWESETIAQLDEWGLQFHELILGKPHADFYIDDKAVHSDAFDWSIE